MSDDEATAFLQEVSTAPLFLPSEWSQIAIAETGADGLIGDIGLCLSPDSKTVEIGFTVERASQGRGLAFRAVSGAISLVFDASPADTVQGITDARNVASVRLLRALGMQHVDTQVAEFRGENCTELTYETTRNGWSKTETSY